jgi:hypothetical protein
VGVVKILFEIVPPDREYSSEKTVCDVRARVPFREGAGASLVWTKNAAAEWAKNWSLSNASELRDFPWILAPRENHCR